MHHLCCHFLFLLPSLPPYPSNLSMDCGTLPHMSFVPGYVNLVYLFPIFILYWSIVDFPGGGHGNSHQDSPCTEEPGRPQSMGHKEVGHG